MVSQNALQLDNLSTPNRILLMTLRIATRILVFTVEKCRSFIGYRIYFNYGAFKFRFKKYDSYL